MKFVRRTQWGASPVSPAAYIGSTRGTKIHYLGEPYSSRSHSGCDDKVRAILSAHLNHPTEDYVDIAYNALVCEHGYVFEGRGAHRRSGANGTAALNRNHYAVCALLGSSGLTVPSDAMLHGLRDAIEWLRSIGNAGGEIQGHRDGYATACPGDRLYAWVRAGAPRPREDELDMTPEEVWEAVFKTDRHPTPGSDPNKDTNPYWTADTYMRSLYARVDTVESRLEALKDDLHALGAKLDAILAKLGS